MERPYFFAGAIFSALSGCQSLHGKLLLHLLQIINENTIQRLFLFSKSAVNAKTGYSKPKTEKHYQKTEIQIPKQK